jgi:uncharacterized protein YggE
MTRSHLRLVAPSLALLLLPLITLADVLPDRRSVTVSGRGEISVTPDRARLSMTAESTKPLLRDAQAEVNRIVRDYLAQARALGAKDEDISAAGLGIRAEYDYSQKNGRRFLGYHVSRGIEVVVRDLDKTGDFLLRATDAGINGVSDPQLESSKVESLQNEALAKAAADAQAKARVLADSLGVKLGAVHTVNSNAEFEAPSMPRMRVMAMAAAAPVVPSGNDEMGFSAGQIKVTATLNADFDLIAP